jgi:hypothetical protein
MLGNWSIKFFFFCPLGGKNSSDLPEAKLNAEQQI